MKLCECGCGQPAPIATQTKRRDGHVKGEPMRFIRGHAHRRSQPDEEPGLCACGCGTKTAVVRGKANRYAHGHNATTRRITSQDFTVEDRGYETPCWIWKHSLSSHGGGQVTISGRKTTAYRAMYEQERGPISAGKVLDHLCEVRACIRPDHMVETTQADHLRRHDPRGWRASSAESDTAAGQD